MELPISVRLFLVLFQCCTNQYLTISYFQARILITIKHKLKQNLQYECHTSMCISTISHTSCIFTLNVHLLFSNAAMSPSRPVTENFNHNTTQELHQDCVKISTGYQKLPQCISRCSVFMWEQEFPDILRTMLLFHHSRAAGLEDPFDAANNIPYTCYSALIWYQGTERQ